MTLKVFISYAKEDRERALLYYDLIVKEGAAPWIDVKQILPGQNWEVEIDRALKDASVIVLLLSKNSVNKRGFVQREANDAIEQLRYKLPTDIYVIPLLLEQCEVPNNISNRLQYVDLNSEGAWDQVKTSLRIASEQQSIQLERGVEAGPFNVFTQKIEERWEGFPGHEIDIEYPKFQSISKQIIAKELNAFFEGRAYRTLIAARQKPWCQLPEIFETQNGPNSDGRWDNFSIAHASQHLLSLTYHVGWYGAGAAHPNAHFETYNFIYLERLFEIDLEEFFEDIHGAIKVISDVCIKELSKEYWLRTGDKPDEAQMKWFREGAGAELNNFSTFNVHEDHFTFLFAPYKVSCYALSTWSVNVSYYELLDFLKPDGLQKFALSKVKE